MYEVGPLSVIVNMVTVPTPTPALQVKTQKAANVKEKTESHKALK